MTTINRQITLAARPVGFPLESDFRLVESPVPEAAEGQFVVQTIYLSVDPYMRGRMNDRKSYAAPVQLGEVMTGRAVGRVITSKHESFAEGDIVNGDFGWQEYALSDGSDVRHVDPAVAPISTSIGVLGMPGCTAYFGLLDVCQPVTAGQTVVVSGAAGAVGATVGQIAKIQGCRVVGVAGSDEKVRYLTEELGFDAGFNYKNTTDYQETFQALCPDGVDIYFDNVGGPISDAVFPLLNVGARVAICGQISQYNLEKAEPGPRLFWHLIIKRAKVQGFLVFEFADRYPEAFEHLTSWVQSGQLKYREQITDGLENAPRAFIGMLKGENIGKQLVKVSDL